MNKEIPHDLISILICQADVIIRAKIISNFNVNDMKIDHYIPFDVSVLETYLGTGLPANLPIKYFYHQGTSFPFLHMINNDLLLFLVDYRHDAYSNCFYFVNNTGNAVYMPYDSVLAGKIKSELIFQAELIKNFQNNTEKFPYEEEIKQLIEDMLDSQKARQSYEKIELLERNAVPAIIKYMNDRRELPIKHIQLFNKSKNAFEAYRHYSPQQVIDVLAAILNQITGMSFGEIHNGGLDFQRTKAYYGWIVWHEIQKRNKINKSNNDS